MRPYPVPNLRRDFAVSVVLLIMAVVAVVPAAIAVVIAVAGVTGLMVLRFVIAMPRDIRPRDVTRSENNEQGNFTCRHAA